jgi:hypothetical protein
MRLNLPAILSVALLFLSVSVNAQFSYINPRPGSKMKNPETGIILRTGQAVNPWSLSNDLISITGSLSGLQAASIKLARDGKTILVTPERPFRGGETVTVTVNDGIRNADGSPVAGTRFDFETHPEWTPEERAAIANARRQIKIDEYGEAAYESMFGTKQQDEQKLICNFLPPFTIESTPGAYYDAPVFYRNQKIIDPICHIATIISSDGDSIFAMYDNDRGIDFKINDNGYLTYYDVSDSSFAMLDSSYALVKKFYMGNGYFADEHEFRVYHDGTSLLMCYDVQIVDLTPYGGPNNAEVTGLVIQQLDADDNVIFEWSGWDHVPLDNTNQSLTNGIVDYIHGNSLELDDDGNLLLSSRHLDEISKIDLSTGEFIWHMGGDANEFTFIDEIGTPKPFSYQHHFRRIGNGIYTLFDNGNNQQPERSMA